MWGGSFSGWLCLGAPRVCHGQKRQVILSAILKNEAATVASVRGIKLADIGGKYL